MKQYVVVEQVQVSWNSQDLVFEEKAEEMKQESQARSGYKGACKT